jgi:hypothetical protein
MERRSVAIVVPLPLRPGISSDEEISLRHLEHYLRGYDRFFIAPEGSTYERPGYEVETFPTRFFGSGKAHGRLQLAEEFYRRFERYSYILMYHLDALAFSDQLMEWCTTDLDYVGAPWLPCSDSPWVTEPRVGNSGFALMKVQSFLQVMQSSRFAVDANEYRSRTRVPYADRQRSHTIPNRYLRWWRRYNGVKWELRQWPDAANSDLFWSDRAVHYWPAFKVASFETGLRFAFEVAPRMCFELNGKNLPFGCHAWTTFDRAFWEPHLLR